MADAPAWATEARENAEKALSALPALTGREEEWRFTPPADLGLNGSEPEAPGTRATVEPPGGERAARFNLVDGAPADPEISSVPDGVIVADLGTALSEHEDLVREHLYKMVGVEDHAGALNAARWEAGTFVYVPANTEVELPVETLTSATGATGRVFGRTLIIVGEDARVTVIDRYASADLPGPVQISSAVELYVAPRGELEHIAVGGWGAGARHHLMIHGDCAADAKLRSVVVSLGGDIVRAEPFLHCTGPHSDARALGLYFADGRQHFEHRVVSRHEAPDSYSNLLYKGALKDQAHTVFYGNLIVPPGAPRTDAYQTNRNLVLSNGARADTIPFLEIETADVRCSHAGAVGRVDDEHLFYLQSRGVPKDVAKRLIVIGFLQEVLEHIGFDELREELEAAVVEKVR